MNDQVKMYLTMFATVLGAVTAALGQMYPADGAPEWVRLTMVVGGAVLAALGSLGISKKVLHDRREARRVAREAEMEVLKSMDPEE